MTDKLFAESEAAALEQLHAQGVNGWSTGRDSNR